MAPGHEGSLYVSIPRPGGSILTLLDERERSRPGWPMVVEGSSFCWRLLPVDDGSVRTVCNALDLPQPELGGADIRAFGFDSGGWPMAGWPVQLRPNLTARILGDELMVLSEEHLSDVTTVPHDVWLEAIAADATIRSGRHVPMVESCCGESWTIGPDGVAYGRIPVEPDPNTEAPQATQLTAIDLGGMVAGWPVGVVSEPAFDAGGKIYMTVGSLTKATTHVEVFEPTGRSPSSVSTELPIAIAEWGVLGGADAARPLIGADGTVFVHSNVGGDTTVYAISGRSGEVMPGWPYRPPTRLVRPGYCGPQDLDCVFQPAVPALSLGNTLYLALQARSQSVGGSLVAVGSDAQVRSGWPVELQRPGAEFWSVVVGPGGTTYALAIEPETGDRSSATILAIAPDSSVLYGSTVVEP